MTADLQRASAVFAELWASTPTAGQHDSRMLVPHEDLGQIALDCDTVHIPDGDLRAVVFTADSGSANADAVADDEHFGRCSLPSAASWPVRGEFGDAAAGSEVVVIGGGLIGLPASVAKTNTAAPAGMAWQAVAPAGATIGGVIAVKTGASHRLQTQKR
ncbi:hypothetical protein AB0E55_19160 [Amycolatopsis keratiniphila]|uniref:MmyB family transcriptional regulator n=1 Tax=Amycolatopsis keratiniphila TaxID=129921 RepID=UPI0033D3F0CA